MSLSAASVQYSFLFTQSHAKPSTRQSIANELAGFIEFQLVAYQ